MKKAILLWILGLFTLVPYGTYYLLFEAQRSEYAFWITAVLFWIFGYWGVVGPLISAMKVRAIMRLLENAQSGEEFKAVLQRADTEDMAIEMIASENGVPKFIARKAYKMFQRRIASQTSNQ